MKYKVEENYCRCHPDTCSCNPWRITSNGNTLVTIFKKDIAEFICCRLNFYEEIVNKLDEKEIDINDVE